MHAGVYAAVLHYLKAVDKVGSPADGRAVVAAMKAMPTDDPLFGKGTHPRRRPQDPPDVSAAGQDSGRIEK